MNENSRNILSSIFSFLRENICRPYFDAFSYLNLFYEMVVKKDVSR